MLIKKRSSDFIVLLRNKLQESGIILKDEVLNMMNNSGTLFSSLVGNELVLATFAPMIPELIFDEVKRMIFKEDVDDLARKLENKKDILNKNFIMSDFGRKLFQDIIKEILNESEKNKREYLKQFLISAYVEQNPQDSFIRICKKHLSEMDSIHIQILELMDDPEDAVRKIFNETTIRDSLLNIRMPQDLNPCIMKADEMAFDTALGDLQRWKLTNIDTTATGGYRPQDVELGLKTISERTRSMITANGRRFLNYMRD